MLAVFSERVITDLLQNFGSSTRQLNQNISAWIGGLELSVKYSEIASKTVSERIELDADAATFSVACKLHYNFTGSVHFHLCNCCTCCSCSPIYNLDRNASISFNITSEARKESLKPTNDTYIDKNYVKPCQFVVPKLVTNNVSIILTKNENNNNNECCNCGCLDKLIGSIIDSKISNTIESKIGKLVTKLNIFVYNIISRVSGMLLLAVNKNDSNDKNIIFHSKLLVWNDKKKAKKN